MTVFYAVGVGVSSNSLEIPKVKSSDVAYAVNFTSGTHILKPKIDKLSCLFDIENLGHQKDTLPLRSPPVTQGDFG